MKALQINGGKPLFGEIDVHGAKNSALPVLAATFMVKGRTVIHNCPNLTDVEAAIKILVQLGCVCLRDNTTVIVDASDAAGYSIPIDLMHEMRSSIVFLGALLARVGRAELTSPGGCEIGKRPIDLHIKALKQLGVIVNEIDGKIHCYAKNGIIGDTVTLSFASVGATENIMLATALSRGTTHIYNAAMEPEISSLADFLNSCGAKIKGAGSNHIIIEGVRQLKGCEYSVIPDRIVASTYLCAAAATGGKVKVNGVVPAHIGSVTSALKLMGADIIGDGNSVTLCAGDKLKPVSLITGVYPAFPTDVGSLFVPLMCKAEGISHLTETIFENRFRFADSLRLMGADIFVEGNKATVRGGIDLYSATAACTDLRGGMALVIAAMMSKGQSYITEVHHILRGYQDPAGCFNSLGADIKEV